MNRRGFLGIMGGVTTALAGCTSIAQPAETPANPVTINPIDVTAALSDGESHTLSVEIPEAVNPARVELHCMVQLRANNPEGAIGGGMVTITDGQGEELYADGVASSYAPGDSRLYEAVEVDATGGDILEITFQAAAGEALAWRFSYGATVG